MRALAPVILIFKALAGPDLFAAPVLVDGYTTRDGTYVAPHAAVRHKRAPVSAAENHATQPDLFTPHPARPGPRILIMRHQAAPAAEAPDLASYDHVLVMFSGGKDSIACVLDLLEQGVDRSKMELWHHKIDGDERNLMDWPVTTAYCREFARAIGIPIYFSHREGGFEREMLRDGTPTAAVVFDKPDGTVGRAGGTSDRVTTRQQFPQTGAIASGRWCSGTAKIDVSASAIRNQERFTGKRTIVVTGERAQESKSRANYETFEPDKAHAKGREVDHYRPIHAWSEARVWDIIRRNGVVPHPAYQLGYGRLSCRNCIFSGPDQWATNHALYPESVATIADYERKFGKTIHRTEDVLTRAAKGTPYAAAVANPRLAKLADSTEWDGSPILVDPAAWRMPAGALNKDKAGPS